MGRSPVVVRSLAATEIDARSRTHPPPYGRQGERQQHRSYREHAEQFQQGESSRPHWGSLRSLKLSVLFRRHGRGLPVWARRLE